MKKLLVLLTVTMAVIGFSTGAFAAWGDPVCTNCKDCELDGVSCGLSSGQNVTSSCGSFEYDCFPNSAVTPYYLTRTGYCDTNNECYCRVLFNICNCEDPAVFDSDATIGIRMTMLVDGVAGHLGAYWADPSITQIEFYKYGLAQSDPCTSLGEYASFGLIDYWQADKMTPANPVVGTIAPCNPLPVANQAVVLMSQTNVGYTITAADVANKSHVWWIDIPGMRIDPNVLHNGELISVKIELLAAESGGICADCDAVCECIVDVAIVCCDGGIEIPLPERFGMYFPYVTWQGAWSTGIVVTNISSIIPYAPMVVAAEDMEVTFVLHDVNGNQFTYFKDDFTTTSWAFSMGALVPDFSGTPADGPAWLEVQTNFAVDGYSYIANGNFGLGTLPRQWSSIIELAKQYLDFFGVSIDDIIGMTPVSIAD